MLMNMETRQRKARFMKYIIADRQPGARSALKVVLGQYPDMEFAGETGEAVHLPGLVAQVKPDLALVEWDMLTPQPDKRVAEIKSVTPVVIIAMNCAAERRAAALSAGVDHYVSKRDNPESLVKILDNLAEES